MYTDRKITGYKADTSSIKHYSKNIQTTKYRYADFYYGRLLKEYIFQLLPWTNTNYAYASACVHACVCSDIDISNYIRNNIEKTT